MIASCINKYFERGSPWKKNMAKNDVIDMILMKIFPQKNDVEYEKHAMFHHETDTLMHVF
jgi:hypothetical protein